MVTQSIIRHLLCDKESLMDYTHGKIVSVDDVTRRLFLLERSENKVIPDHYYRLNQEQSFDRIDTLSDIFIKGLCDLSSEYLELSCNRIYVKQAMQTQWQELITYIPPLVLQAAFLHAHAPLTDYTLEGCRRYYHDYIQPNFTYTALPHPHIPQLEHYISGNGGLCDLHMHLNGSTETDLIWQDFLFDPEEAYTALMAKQGNTKVVEQKEQEALTRCDRSLDEMLCSARAIRQYLFDVVTFPFCDDQDDETKKRYNLSLQELLCLILNEQKPFDCPSAYHPFCDLFARHDDTPESWLPVEALMYILIFRSLEVYPRESVASMFHFYLLILGLTNRLLVQQTHQYGFEQFQKLTLNDLRRHSERDYRIRFLQLHGNERRNIKYLEGRFSPQLSKKGNEKLLQQISEGWAQLVGGLEADGILDAKSKPTLQLIAHFIKRPDETQPDVYVRHKKLRSTVWQCANALVSLLPDHTDMNSDRPEIVGADAASSEFDAPPEVFAPAFRFLKHRGMRHFTYHAGEDFFHILGGLRAIYEAVEFNDLGCGDRIGHATAVGVDPEVWIRNVGDEILVRRGEYLDDLVFAYHLITKGKEKLLKPVLPYLEREIDELAYKVYGRSYPLSVLMRAWLLRKFNPELLFTEKREDACSLSTFDAEEWDAIQNELPSKNRLDEDFVQLLMRYHHRDSRKAYNEIMEVKPCAIFDITQISELQLAMLRFIHEKEIAIETLPTSNVRIGHHHTFETYHLWRWLKWQEEGQSIPPIVVGTDDAGIFATNIYNEFANIYCHLVCQHTKAHSDAMHILEQLDKNGQIYNFMSV